MTQPEWEKRLTPSVVALIETHLEIDGKWLTTSWWECADSPTGYCIYNPVDDPACDCCLFCGDPEERK